MEKQWQQQILKVIISLYSLLQTNWLVLGKVNYFCIASANPYTFIIKNQCEGSTAVNPKIIP